MLYVNRRRIMQSRFILQMRIMLFFLMLSNSIQLLAIPLKSQDIYKVQIRLELKNESLVNTFKKIESKSLFYFMYRNEDVKDINNINVANTKQSIAAFLNLILANTKLGFKQIDQRILIIHKDDTRNVANFSQEAVSSQKPLILFDDNIVSGLVTDDGGTGLSGVSITLKGTSLGTTTDTEGKYKIAAPSNGVLSFTYVGYETQEVPVNNKTTINVRLLATMGKLNEVVVTALGIKRETKSLTYSTQNVSVKQLTEARELNIMNSLEGKVAGLSINNSGTGLGADARVILRGNRSISGDSQPLYVIDGVPIRGNPSNLSLDNIASLSVLKGPNAAALYGSAAQNGAIIIETKKGQAGAVHISLNNTYMLLDPDLTIPFQNVYGQGSGGVYQKTSEFAWGSKMEGQMVSNWSLDPAQAGTQYAYTPQPGNKDGIYQNGSNFSSSLFASVGGEKTQTAFSYTLSKAKGIFPGNQLQRHNLSLRVTNKLSSRLSLDSKIDYMRQQIDNQLAEGESNFNPNRQIYTMPSNIHREDAAHFDFVDATGRLRQNYWNPTTTTGSNPYWMLNRNPNKFTLERVIALTSLTYDISDAFKLMVRGSYDGANGSNEEKLYNDTYVRAPDGRYTVGKNSAYQLNGDFLLSYKTQLAKNLTANANAGGSVQKKRNNSVSSNTGLSMIIPNFFTLANTNLPVTSNDPGLSSDIQSLYAFANVAWKNAVFLDVTARNDWGSTLPENNRSYFYPSVGLSAVLSDLIPSFPQFISFAKLRGSWAEVGNSAPPYMLERTASFRAGGNFGFLTLNSTLPNPDLRPEKTKSTELGLDIRFFKGRLGFDITTYKTNTVDQLFTIALPVGSGAAQYFTNGGDVQNKGVEVLLTATPIQSKSFTWDASFNFAANRNKVIKISDERPRIVVGNDPYVREFVIEQGQPYGQIYSKGWMKDANGNVIIGTNGMPKITAGRTVQIANFNPDWMGGISNTFTYKDFSLSFLIEHRQGGSVVSMTNAILYGAGLTEATLQGRDGGLIFGDNFFSNLKAAREDGSKNTIPVNAETFWLGVGGRNTPVGEAFVSSATNTRFRELTLGYSLPKKVFGKSPIAGIKLSIVGRNLFYIHRAAPDLDTDFMQGTTPDSEGFQSFAPPTTRSYGLNLKVDFE